MIKLWSIILVLVWFLPISVSKIYLSTVEDNFQCSRFRRTVLDFSNKLHISWLYAGDHFPKQTLFLHSQILLVSPGRGDWAEKWSFFHLAWAKLSMNQGQTVTRCNNILGSDKTGSALALRETKLTWRSESPFLVGRTVHRRQGKLCFNLRNVQILLTIHTIIYYQISNLSIVFLNPVEWPHIHWYIIPAAHLSAMSSNAENWPQ